MKSKEGGEREDENDEEEAEKDEKEKNKQIDASSSWIKHSRNRHTNGRASPT